MSSYLLIFSNEKLVSGKKKGMRNEGWPIQKGCKLISKTKIWNNGLKGLKQQTSYSSVPLKQTDLLLDTLPRHGSRLTPKQLSSSSLLASLFLYFLSPSFGCAQCKIGLYPPPVKERKYKWAYTQGQLATASYITTDSVVYVFS